jgi:hypothetical protein
MTLPKLKKKSHPNGRGGHCFEQTQQTYRYNSSSTILNIYKTIILPVVLYWCKIWSLTLREKRGPRMFENSVLGRIFGPNRDEVTCEWRKLHNVGLNDLHYPPNIVRVIKSRM